MSGLSGDGAGQISREAGDKQKGFRFQKLRAAIRFLERVEQNATGRVLCAIELFEDSVIYDGSAQSLLNAEENKLYSTSLSFNSTAVKNTLVAFIDLSCAFQQSSELKLGFYASATTANERVPASVHQALGITSGATSYSILNKLVAGAALTSDELCIARHLIKEEYKKQYPDSQRPGFFKIFDQWSLSEFEDFLAAIDWAISDDTNETLEVDALRLIRSSRFFTYRHEELQPFILSRLLDLLESRSGSRKPTDRLVTTSDVELIFNQCLGPIEAASEQTKPLDPAADTWNEIETNDMRNLEQKIRDVVPAYPGPAMNRLARRCSLARGDATVFEREYISLRRRILDVCEEELEKIGIPNSGVDAKKVNEILDGLTSASVSHIATLSRSYRYNIKDPVVIGGAVLTLFDDCFLSFDGQHGTDK